MTITTALSPARSHAFHTTVAAQHQRGGQVQFSLPPVQDATASAGSSTPAAVRAPAASGAGALSRNTLPIAVPVGTIAGLTASVPAAAPTPTPPAHRPVGKPGVTLPIAVPIAGGGSGGLGTVTPLQPVSAAPPPTNRPGNPIVTLPIAPVSGIGTLSNQGNFLSAQLITRLYQRGG
jgi:hypothetical protein